MGYFMELRDFDFTIPADKAADALEAIQALDPVSHGAGGGSWSGGQKVESWFAWVNTKAYKYATDLGQAFDAWRWELTQKPNGDWVLDGFRGAKLGDDELFFKTVAPFVTPGSYIEMQGEDGARWRWVFDGTTCKEKQGRISWED